MNVRFSGHSFCVRKINIHQARFWVHCFILFYFFKSPLCRFPFFDFNGLTVVRALADVVRAAWSPKRVNSTVFITQTAVICSPIRQSLQIIFNYLEIFFFGVLFHLRRRSAFLLVEPMVTCRPICSGNLLVSRLLAVECCG